MIERATFREREALSPCSTDQSALVTSVRLEWKAFRKSLYLPNDRARVPVHMEMYSADKWMPNWQAEEAVDDLFPVEWSLFSHQASDGTPQGCGLRRLKNVQRTGMVSGFPGSRSC